MKKVWYVYLCGWAGTLYTGINTDLEHRMKLHRAKLLYTEAFDDKHSAANREKDIKGWRRENKMQLIESKR
jgi:putative endonuclease